MFHRMSTVGKALSIELAATVITHGDVFTTVSGKGPPFPPEQTTGIPLASHSMERTNCHRVVNIR